MRIPSFGQILSTVSATVTVASIVANVMPKSTVLCKYPRLEAAYQTVVDFVSILAFNISSYLPALNIHVPRVGFTAPPPDGKAATVTFPGPGTYSFTMDEKGVVTPAK